MSDEKVTEENVNKQMLGYSTVSTYVLLLLQDRREQGHLLIWNLAQVAWKVGLVRCEGRGGLRGNLLS